MRCRQSSYARSASACASRRTKLSSSSIAKSRADGRCLAIVRSPSGAIAGAPRCGLIFYLLVPGPLLVIETLGADETCGYLRKPRLTAQYLAARIVSWYHFLCRPKSRLGGLEAPVEQPTNGSNGARRDARRLRNGLVWT